MTRGSTVGSVLPVLILAGAVTPAAQPPYAGSSLTDVLEGLRARGLVIVYSSAAVRPDMVVEHEPESTDPRRILDEVLAPFDLAVRDAPGGVLVIVAAAGAVPATGPTGTIRGEVRIEGDHTPPPGVSVWVEGTGLATTVAADGRFSIDRVPAGEHVVVAAGPSLREQRIGGIAVRDGRVARMSFVLQPVTVFLSEIVVTPSHFRIRQAEPESRLFLDRDQLRELPNIADDPYRAVKRLPGAAGGDVSATFNVRGGGAEELLVLLDGAELYEPYHLKDFRNIFSIIDGEAVGGVDFLTGGFPVEYGDRMSGVMDISLSPPGGPRRTVLGLGTLNGRFVSEGSFADGRGWWLATGRGWYPTLILDATGSIAEEILADYYDLLARVERRLGSRWRVAVGLLAASDDIGFSSRADDEIEEVESESTSQQLWIGLDTDRSDRLSSRTVLSAATIRRQRAGGYVDLVEGTLTIADDRTFEVLGLRQDWRLRPSDRHFVKAGFDVKHQRADYDYSSVNVVTDPAVVGDGPPVEHRVETMLSPNGEAYGAWIADRFRVAPPLIVELGLRWDKQFWIDDHQLSPRVNLMYDATPRTTLRAAWGHFHQSPRLNELQVADGVTEFHPAQLAEHWLASVEHTFERGAVVRVEAYHKELSHLSPRFENLFNPLELFPEARPDRVRIAPDGGRARGFEVLVKGPRDPRLAWWAAWTLAEADDLVDGRWVPRSWDQRHAVTFGVNLDLGRGWDLNLAGTYHSGWPTTAVDGVVVGEVDGEPEVSLELGPRNGARFAHYQRLDVRVGRTFELGRGSLEVVVEAINLTNRANPCCVDDFATEVLPSGDVVVTPEERFWAPIVPSLGVSWHF